MLYIDSTFFCLMQSMPKVRLSNEGQSSFDCTPPVMEWVRVVVGIFVDDGGAYMG